ncbi:MAG: ABC transporter permease subunit [Nitriliruptoraceae bacterium]|nr:ABC transporter permease subunit [Nitriliruptoraceae bacterium]
MMGATLAQQAVPRDTGVFEFLLDPDRWTGSTGILASGADSVLLCAAVIVTSIVLAVPAATVLAHGRRLELTSAWVVNIGRAMPTFGVAGLLVPFSLRAGYGFEPWPIFIALTLLTVPPMYLSTYTAIRQVPAGAVDAARAVGYTERDVLLRVELPLALRVIGTGVRVAAVQVVATEPIRAFLGGDGLGRYVRDGLGQNNSNLVIAGAILIGLLAASTGLLFAGLEWLLMPAGVRRLGGARTGRVQSSDATILTTDDGDGEAAGGPPGLHVASEPAEAGASSGGVRGSP